MRLLMLRLLVLTILCLGAAAAGPAAAQVSEGQAAIEQWTHRLDLIEQQLYRADTTAESAGGFLEATGEVRGKAEALIEAMQPEVEARERRLAALGPPPEEGQGEEAPEVAQQRQALQMELQQVKALITQANLVIVQADELDKLVGTLTQRKRFEALFRAYPAPWAMENWRTAGPEFFSIINQIARSPVAWWQNLEAEERRSKVSLRIGLQLLLAIAAGWLLRRWLLGRYGRDPSASQPSYSARLLAAIASAVARGIIPALVFAGLLYAARPHYEADASLFWTVVTTFLAVMVFFSLAWAVPYAVLSPDLPQWRLLPVTPDNSRRLGWRFALLAGLFAAAIFLFEAQKQIGVSDAYFSLSTFIVILVLALPVIDISRQRYWRRELISGEAEAAEAGTAGEAAAGEDEGSVPESALWRFLRRLIAPIALAGIVAAFFGYADLADFLISNLLLSILILVAMAILRGLVRELIGAAMRSNAVSNVLGLAHVLRNRLKFWLRFLLDTVLAIAAPVLIASIWFAPFGEYWAEARRLASGITIGGVTISFSDMVVALAVFAVLLALTRLGQRFLTNRVLPNTGFDIGVQNSLSAGLGYIGVIVAAAFGISALGIDLSNIALIAGALSVGIGFGLQAVVSNFVSGIILLIERPIKVGDWVLVGGNEGTVKRITVRSTELTTFQRASVIIPNSEFISTSVINWTHKDTYGRIEISIGVAYGSDVEKVREVLLDCANHHEKVLTSPEPQVLFVNFGNSSLDFELRCFTNEVSYRLMISSDLRFAIDKAFREAGIEIPFPQHVIHFADQAKLPEPGRSEAGPPA
ncbi:mechanosensitive ion channel domain-containing protein [Pelagibius sp. CAU 1746]|uniref:mechanosensitive ion channel domain-containing protein n=1 Tax=Pelagibius sp. CAU 1746 TaxID=3140370 RepID=UPI00325B0AC1